MCHRFKPPATGEIAHAERCILLNALRASPGIKAAKIGRAEVRKSGQGENDFDSDLPLFLAS
jgi:hypothetical protein